MSVASKLFLSPDISRAPTHFHLTCLCIAVPTCLEIENNDDRILFHDCLLPCRCFQSLSLRSITCKISAPWPCAMQNFRELLQITPSNP